MYLKLETESEIEHSATKEGTELTTEYDPHALVVTDTDDMTAQIGTCLCGWTRRSASYSEICEAHDEHRQGKETAVLATLVCSCGSTLCPAIITFGLPEPTFHDAIEPIPSQGERDRRAVAIRAGL